MYFLEKSCPCLSHGLRCGGSHKTWEVITVWKWKHILATSPCMSAIFTFVHKKEKKKEKEKKEKLQPNTMFCALQKWGRVDPDWIFIFGWTYPLKHFGKLTKSKQISSWKTNKKKAAEFLWINNKTKGGGGIGFVTVRIQPVGTLCDFEHWGLLGSKEKKKKRKNTTQKHVGGNHGCRRSQWCNPHTKSSKLGISLDTSSVCITTGFEKRKKNDVRCRGVSVCTELYLGRSVENNTALASCSQNTQNDSSRSVRAGFTCWRVSSLQQRTLLRPGLGQLLHHFFWKVFFSADNRQK